MGYGPEKHFEDDSPARPKSLPAAPVQDAVNHPGHYGGVGHPYEAIKVIEAWGLGFNLGNAVKYVARAGKKPTACPLDDLKKAAWYLQREIENRTKAK